MIAAAGAAEATRSRAARFSWVLAAAAALVPPAVLLGSTHSVAVLVRAHRVGLHYWCALAMTFVLAGCAFVLSFDALRELAVALGMPPGRAWLWPLAIDVSIANSTLALLSLAPARAAPRVADHGGDAGAARARRGTRWRGRHGGLGDADGVESHRR